MNECKNQRYGQTLEQNYQISKILQISRRDLKGDKGIRGESIKLRSFVIRFTFQISLTQNLLILSSLSVAPPC